MSDPPTHIDPLLAHFRTAWIDWGLKQSELERQFNLYPHEVKAMRARCRELGLAPPAESTHGGPPPLKLPSRAELEQQWLDGDLPLRPVADGLDLLAAHLDASVDQLRRHFRKIGFSPKHPLPRLEVKGALDVLLSRPWCNRLGPNFAGTELRRLHGWDVRPVLVRELLAELDPTGSRRRLKTHKRGGQADIAGRRQRATRATAATRAASATTACIITREPANHNQEWRRDRHAKERKAEQADSSAWRAGRYRGPPRRHGGPQASRRGAAALVACLTPRRLPDASMRLDA